MSTNYYARIIPSKTKRELLKMLIDTNDFEAINKAVSNIYSRFSVNYAGETSGGEIHLGKRSCGWKFLWNPNMYILRHFHKEEEISESGGRIVSRFVDDPDTVFSLYPLTKEGIKSFIDRDDIIVVDEYGDKQNKEEFWKMALSWGSDEENGGWDDASYEEYERKRHPGFYCFKCSDNLTKFLEQEGKVKFTSEMHGDFYSDGLRFATFINFS